PELVELSSEQRERILAEFQKENPNYFTLVGVTVMGIVGGVGHILSQARGQPLYWPLFILLGIFAGRIVARYCEFERICLNLNKYANHEPAESNLGLRGA